MFIDPTAVMRQIRETYRGDADKVAAFRELLTTYLAEHVTDATGRPTSAVCDTDKISIRVQQRAETDAALLTLLEAIRVRFPEAARTGITKVLADTVFAQVVEFHSYNGIMADADRNWGTQRRQGLDPEDHSWGSSLRRGGLVSSASG